MWMKVDDRLHSHRKTRAVTKSHSDKTRDIAPMGLWVAAGSWSAQNGTDGWVPEDELDRWDDDWKLLVDRLINGGYWWAEERDGEQGYGFNDWEDYNPSSENASRSGEFGNHVRWHVKRSIVDPDCEHCPKEPDSAPDDDPDSLPDIGGRSGGDIGGNRSTRTRPDPTRPDPTPRSASASAEREFEAWYALYPRKRGKGQAAKAYRAARKKVDAETLLDAVRQQTPTLTAKGDEFTPYPATWLNGERWDDEPPQQQRPRRLPEVHDLELPPDGLSDEEYATWQAEQRRRRA